MKVDDTFSCYEKSSNPQIRKIDRKIMKFLSNKELIKEVYALFDFIVQDYILSEDNIEENEQKD